MLTFCLFDFISFQDFDIIQTHQTMYKLEVVFLPLSSMLSYPNL